MSVWLDKTGRHTNGGHRPSGQTTVRSKFQKFRWKSFLFESHDRTVRNCHPDGRTSTANNFHIKVPSVRTRRMGIRTVNLMHTISISDARASEPCWLSSGRLDLNCDTCLMDERVRTGIHFAQTVAVIFPYLCLERNPEACLNTEGRPNGLLNRLDVCKLKQVEASRHRGRSGRESMSSGQMIL